MYIPAGLLSAVSSVRCTDRSSKSRNKSCPTAYKLNVLEEIALLNVRTFCFRVTNFEVSGGGMSPDSRVTPSPYIFVLTKLFQNIKNDFKRFEIVQYL